MFINFSIHFCPLKRPTSLQGPAPPPPPPPPPCPQCGHHSEVILYFLSSPNFLMRGRGHTLSQMSSKVHHMTTPTLHVPYPMVHDGDKHITPLSSHYAMLTSSEHHTLQNSLSAFFPPMDGILLITPPPPPPPPPPNTATALKLGERRG